MRNSLVLLHEKNGQRLTHGGGEAYRVRSLWLNGVRVWYEAEGSAPGYNRSTYFDKSVSRNIDLFEKAAGVKAQYAKIK